MNTKTLLIMILIIALGVGSVYANTTEDEAAKALNEISILKGDGNSFNLDGELTRAEGATFIVRLLGMEEQVLANKIDYVALNFTDVHGTDWFSPYVGYCVEKGIINGYSDQTFRAQDKLSEQAFVKMVLGAMGYEYGKDFTWAETLTFAYNKNVVLDTKYANMTSSADAYTRGEVVQLLHHVMSQKHATKGGLMVDILIDSNILSRSEAIEYGFISDTLIMEVEELKQNKGLSFTVRFNEVPYELKADNIIIKEKYSDTTIEASKITVSDIAREFYITASDQIADKEYILTLTGIKDMEDNLMEDYTHEFFGYRLSNYNSNYFRIANAELSAMNMLDITFTQPVDINTISGSDISILRAGSPFLSGSDTTLKLNVDASNPYILHVEFLNFDFTFADSFECAVSESPKSLYGASVKNGLGDQVRFSAVAYEVEEFAYVSTVYENENSLILTFNKNINETIAKQVFSYYLTTDKDIPIEILNAEVIKSGDLAGKQVRLTTGLLIAEDSTYKMIINQAYDTNRSASIIEEPVTFVAKSVTKPKLIIKAVSTTRGNRVEVALSEYLDAATATDVNLYSIKDMTTGFAVAKPSKVYYDKYLDQPTVILEFNNNLVFTNGHAYTLTIKDSMKVDSGLTIYEDVSETFVDNKAAYKTKAIQEVVYIGNNIIMIKGSEEFALEVPNVLNSNYSLSYMVGETKKSIQPIGTTYFNEHIILVRFESILMETQYTFTANSIKTMYGETINTSVTPLEVKVEVLN